MSKGQSVLFAKKLGYSVWTIRTEVTDNNGESWLPYETISPAADKR